MAAIPPGLSTDSSQTVQWRWQGEAFGLSAANDDVDGDSNLTTINLRFPGQYYDQETRLHYNWNRYYDPALGRYVTSDPIGLLGGDLNVYAYVKNDPINWIDDDALNRTRSGQRGGNPYGGYGTNQYNVPVLRNDWQSPHHSQPVSNVPLRPRTDRELLRELIRKEQNRREREFRDKTLQNWPEKLIPINPEDFLSNWLEPPANLFDLYGRRVPEVCGADWPNNTPNYSGFK